MNTPRPPNVRPGTAHFLTKIRNIDISAFADVFNFRAGCYRARPLVKRLRTESEPSSHCCACKLTSRRRGNWAITAAPGSN
jgi:hypothetical protein